MAPNKTDLILKRIFPELTQLSIPAMPPPAIDDSYNRFADIFIGEGVKSYKVQSNTHITLHFARLDPTFQESFDHRTT